MITTYSHKKVTWIDIFEPTTDDITEIINKYHIHPAWAHELLIPSERSKTGSDEKFFYAVFHYPDHPATNRALNDIEVDYVISEKVLITAHYGTVDTFNGLIEKIEEGENIHHAEIHTGADLFLAINGQLYRGLREEIEPIRKEIKKVESEIFNGNELHMVKELSRLKRRLLNFKQTMRSHKIILKSLEMQAPRMFPHTTINSDTLFREYFRVENALENNYELVKELHETNDSLLSSKNNDVTKRFTMMAFFTFPLALIVTILGLHNAPTLFKSSAGFYVIVSIVIILFLGMYSYFKYKKWM